LYETAGASLVDDLFKGINRSFIAVGLKGTGKSYSLHGDLDNQERIGLSRRIIKDIFKNIKTDSDIEYSMEFSFVEVYQDSIFDLMTKSDKILRIKENFYDGVFVENAQRLV
jgi:hypothetical protein